MMSSFQTVGQDPNKITALYEKLSRDDDQVGDSNSIVNQKNTSKAMPSKEGTLIFCTIPMTVGAVAISTVLHGSSWRQILKPVRLPM